MTTVCELHRGLVEMALGLAHANFIFVRIVN
jgi:hypothetical protein